MPVRTAEAAGARALVESESFEIGLYERYRDYVSYGDCVARKVHCRA